MIDSFRGEYRFLSNFHMCPVSYEGEVYPSVEHAYQAAKTEDWAAREQIRLCPKPGDAKRLGQKVKMRTDFDNIKVDIMRELLRQKFAPGTELAEKLVATGKFCRLVEGNWWGDKFWGVCDGVGQNHLGELLMQIRGELQND